MTLSTYLGFRFYANDVAKSLTQVASEPANAKLRSYYLANIGKVTSVSQFVNDYKLFHYAMNAFGLNNMGGARAFMTKVLESDLSNPASFANKLSDSRYRAFAREFQFDAKGNVTNAAKAQTSLQRSDTVAKFAAASTESASAQSADTTYYQSHIGAVSSAEGLEADPTLYRYVLTAYGIDSTTPAASVASALESDVSDPHSFPNKSGNAGLQALAADFNFASDGSVTTQRALQSPSMTRETVRDYSLAMGFDATTPVSAKDTASQKAAKAETAYYQKTVPLITSLGQFLSDKRLVAYAEKAYGVPTTTTSGQLKAVLTSDPNDPKGVADKLGDPFKNLAAAYNVTKSGTIARDASLEVQSKAQLFATTNGFATQSLETEAGNTQGTGVQLALYFRRLAPSLTNAYQILADPALTKVVQTTLSLPATSSNANIDVQARTISSKLKFADLRDPAKLDRLIARFASLYDIKSTGM